MGTADLMRMIGLACISGCFCGVLLEMDPVRSCGELDRRLDQLRAEIATIEQEKSRRCFPGLGVEIHRRAPDPMHTLLAITLGAYNDVPSRIIVFGGPLTLSEVTPCFGSSRAVI
jgi:hypothetical protein